MNKKLIISMLMLSCLIFLPITTKADYPTGTLGYSDEIAVGNEYEWTVKTSIFEGDFSDYTYYATIGSQELSKGDKIKLVVTDDPDTAVGDWYESYLDGVLLPDSSLGEIIDYGLDYAYDAFFINPVTYTNATGTYNIYEQILEEVTGANVDETYEYSTEYSGYTYDYSYNVKVEYSIQGDVFVYQQEIVTDILVDMGSTQISQYQKVKIDSTVNIITGLLGKIEFLIEVDADISTTTITGKMHFVLDSGYASTPYSWAFSFLGLTVIAAVVGLAKRKR